jgi:hypothetical protein
MGALYMVTAHGSREALDYLVGRYNVDDEDRSIIVEGIEQTSSRLDLRVIRDGAMLRVEVDAASGQRPIE